MLSFRHLEALGIVLLSMGTTVYARPQATTAESSSSPSSSTTIDLNGSRLIRFNGTLTNQMGRPLSGVVGVTFAIYKDQQDGSPLWVENQNVRLDNGNYT